MREEAGAGTALGVGVAAAIVAVMLLLAPLAVLLDARHRAAAAADAAALAAGDVALGVAVGVPCDRAVQVAVAQGAAVQDCAQHGRLVRVRAAVSVLGTTISSDAVAGPPGAQ